MYKVITIIQFSDDETLGRQLLLIRMIFFVQLVPSPVQNTKVESAVAMNVPSPSRSVVSPDMEHMKSESYDNVLQAGSTMQRRRQLPAS